jgi:hypothetical protein
VLRRIFGPKKEKAAGENCIKISFITCTHHKLPKCEIRLARHVASREEIINEYKRFVGKYEKKILIKTRT